MRLMAKGRQYVAAACFALSTPAPASAQDLPSTLAWVVDDQVTGGAEDQYEAAWLETVAHRVDHNFPFSTRVFASDESVYRRTTFFITWQDLDTRADWLDNVPMSNGIRAMDRAHVSRSVSIWRARPDLGHVPDDPRVNPASAPFMRELRLRLEPGSEDGVDAILTDISTSYAKHGLRDSRLVYALVVGHGVPTVSIFVPARSPADWRAQQERNRKRLGDDGLRLQERLRTAIQSLSWKDWTIRTDLDYQPTPISAPPR